MAASEPALNTVEEAVEEQDKEGKRKPFLSLLRPKSEIVKDRWLIDNFSITRGRKSISYNSKIDPTKVIITEYPDRIVSYSSSEQAAKSVIRIARNKEWSTIKLSGTQEFKQMAWLEASLQGMTVKGYKPNEQDKAILNELSTKKSQPKGTPENTVTQAFSETVASDPSLNEQSRAALIALFNDKLADLEKQGYPVGNMKSPAEDLEAKNDAAPPAAAPSQRMAKSTDAKSKPDALASNPTSDAAPETAKPTQGNTKPRSAAAKSSTTTKDASAQPAQQGKPASKQRMAPTKQKPAKTDEPVKTPG